MSLQIYLQARHVCERCGHETWIDMVPLGCSGQARDPRADVLMKMDCDAVTWHDCLGLLEEQAEVEAKHAKATVEYEAGVVAFLEQPEPVAPFEFDQRWAA